MKRGAKGPASQRPVPTRCRRQVPTRPRRQVRRRTRLPAPPRATPEGLATLIHADVDGLVLSTGDAVFEGVIDLDAAGFIPPPVLYPGTAAKVTGDHVVTGSQVGLGLASSRRDRRRPHHLHRRQPSIERAARARCGGPATAGGSRAPARRLRGADPCPPCGRHTERCIHPAGLSRRRAGRPRNVDLHQSTRESAGRSLAAVIREIPRSPLRAGGSDRRPRGPLLARSPHGSAPGNRTGCATQLRHQDGDRRPGNRSGPSDRILADHPCWRRTRPTTRRRPQAGPAAPGPHAPALVCRSARVGVRGDPPR